MQSQLATSAAVAPFRAARAGPAGRGRLVTRATANRPSGNPVRREVERFFQRYDVPSAGVGALTVTSYCVWRGQDPWTALSITFAATVAALVINECLFDQETR